MKEGEKERENGNYFLLRLVNPKVILSPFNLSFLFTLAMNSFKSCFGVSLAAGFADLAVLAVISISLNNVISNTNYSIDSGVKPDEPHRMRFIKLDKGQNGG